MIKLLNPKTWFNNLYQEFESKKELCLIDTAAVLQYLQQTNIKRTDKLTKTKIVAVDFETTGLDSNNDRIISMGFCPIVNFKIKLADCLHLVVKPDRELEANNVTIHGLTDDKVTEGVSAKEAMDLFLKQTQGAVILAHYHKIEREFSQRLASNIIGSSLPLYFLDTLEMAQKLKNRRHQPIANHSLRLFNLRKEFGLPSYNAHNALEDAIATAELFFALFSELGLSKSEATLADLGLRKYRK